MYLGEITPERITLFHATFMQNSHMKNYRPNITEITLPDGKLYLSAMIDCFDWMVIGWTIGSRFSADLVDTMLNGLIAGLRDGCYPTVHLNIA